jgi:hypothetical protein
MIQKRPVLIKSLFTGKFIHLASRKKKSALHKKKDPSKKKKKENPVKWFKAKGGLNIFLQLFFFFYEPISLY